MISSKPVRNNAYFSIKVTVQRSYWSAVNDFRMNWSGLAFSHSMFSSIIHHSVHQHEVQRHEDGHWAVVDCYRRLLSPLNSSLRELITPSLIRSQKVRDSTQFCIEFSSLSCADYFTQVNEHFFHDRFCCPSQVVLPYCLIPRTKSGICISSSSPFNTFTPTVKNWLAKLKQETRKETFSQSPQNPPSRPFRQIAFQMPCSYLTSLSAQII
jgi:hypothetical protein